MKVNEDAKEAEICLLIESPLNDCPLSFPFEIYFSTFSYTAGMLLSIMGEGFTCLKFLK